MSKTLIDFWSPQCGPCLQLSPIIDEVAEENPDVQVRKVNVLEQMDEALAHGVRALPTLVFLKDGEPVKKLIGLQSKEVINDTLKSI